MIPTLIFVWVVLAAFGLAAVFEYLNYKEENKFLDIKRNMGGPKKDFTNFYKNIKNKSLKIN